MSGPTTSSRSPSAIILYGTETGTAQDLALEVGRCLEQQQQSQQRWRRPHFSLVDVLPFDSVPFSLLSHYSLTIFVLATTGQGEFPSNARKFWTSLLRKKLGSTTLQDVQYALVGLGSSSYAKFNWAARKLDKRLKMLGAKEILESCECDEVADGSTESAFEEWIGRLEAEVLRRWPLSQEESALGRGHSDGDGVGETATPSKWILMRTDEIESSSSKESNIFQESQPRDSDDSFEAILECNDRVTPSTHWQDVRFLRLSTRASIDYKPGDCLAIHPENTPADVNYLLSLMDWGSIADIPLVLVPNPAYQQPRSSVFHLSSPLPDLITSPSTCPSHSTTSSTTTSSKSTSLRQLLTSHLDITAIPRRSFFRQLARFTTNPMHKERLVEFTNPEFLDEYYDYATRPRRSILEVLQEFDSVKLPWNEVCNVIPALRPRQFSICSGGGSSSSSTDTKTTFELLIAIVKYRTVLRKIREGVCTRYLAQLPAGSKLGRVEWKREGRFSGVTETSTSTSTSTKTKTRKENEKDKISNAKHLILIGAGTGVAPLRSLIQDKLGLSHLRDSATTDPQTQTQAQTQTQITLFFGCRNKSADYYFATEWENYQLQQQQQQQQEYEEEEQFKIYTAFSRDRAEEQGGGGGGKTYVQDRIRQNSRQVGSVLVHDTSAVVVVCGASGQMPKAVRLALKDCVRRRLLLLSASEAGAGAEAEAEAGTAGSGGVAVAVTSEVPGHTEAEAEWQAEQLLARMDKEGRYKQETWS